MNWIAFGLVIAIQLLLISGFAYIDYVWEENIKDLVVAIGSLGISILLFALCAGFGV